MSERKLESHGRHLTGTDYGYSVATDGAGNIYVTGNSNTSWNGPDGESPIIPTGGNGSDIFVLKMDSNATYQWYAFYGSENWEYGHSIAVDGSGNPHTVGLSFASWNGPGGESPRNAHSGGDNGNIVVIKLDADGNYGWHTFYGGDHELKDIVVLDWIPGKYSLAVDRNDHIYVSGYYLVSWKGPDNQAPLNPHAGGECYPSQIVVEFPTECPDIFVLMLNPSGDYQWHTFYGGNNSFDTSYSLCVDDIGNIYVGGYSVHSWISQDGQAPLNAHSGFNDVFVLKFKN